MNSIYFNIYGFGIKISSFDFSLEALKVNQDFGYFKTKPEQKSLLEISIKNLTVTTLSGIIIGKTGMCDVRQLSLNRRQLVFRHNQGILALVDDFSSGKGRRIDLSAANESVIDDVLYFLVNACAGEFLDSAGLVRIHALTFSCNDRAGLVFGFPGAGKSTVAVELLKIDGVRIYSDEISVFDIKNKLLLPYPIRIAVTEKPKHSSTDTKFTYFFNTKYLISLETSKIAKSGPLTNLYFLDKTRRPAIFYFLSIVLGLGLIQMWEYLLRLNNPSTLIRIFGNRIKLCMYLKKFEPRFLTRELSLAEKIKAIS